MTRMVITVIGDDRAGLVEALSGAVASHGGNWERSHMAELAGKFAGIVEISIPPGAVSVFVSALDQIETSGLLDVTVETASSQDEPSSEGESAFSLSLTGQDHSGIVHDISTALAGTGASIDELETEVVPAPNGGKLFKAHATVVLPAGVDLETVEAALESVSHDLMVDLDTAS